MQTTELSSELLSTCEMELARALACFEDAPARSGFLDIAAVAEILVLGDSIPESDSLRRMVWDGAARWLHSGLIEDMCFSRVELTYPAALLAYMAQRGATYSPADMTVMRRLCEGRLIGRSEMPVLTQQLISAYLTRCGIHSDFGDLGRRDLVKMVDKRILRGRVDEYDVQVVLMCAQLLQLDPSIRDKPSLYPRAMLVEAVRSGNANWLPVLAFLCANSFSLDEGLRQAALQSILQALPHRGELVPGPQGTGIDKEYIGRAGRGLRIRSTVALIYSLCTLGDLYAQGRARVAVG